MGKRKSKRIKRSHLKRFSSSVISTGQGPEPIRMQEYYRHLDNLAARGGPFINKSQALNARLRDELKEDQRDLGLSFYHIAQFVANQVQRRKTTEEIQQFIHLKESFETHHIILQNSNSFRLVLCWLGHEYKFLKFKGIENTVYISRPYDSREQAMNRYQSNRIFWSETIPIHAD